MGHKNRSSQMKITSCFVLGFICALMQSQLYGQDTKKVGTASAAFLRIPVGTKGIAMGSAFTAVADDGSAMFWNPGNIAVMPKRNLFVHHSNWLPGLDFDYFGFLMPLQHLGVIGINVSSLRTEEMEVTTPEAPMGTGETFTAASMAVGIAYAKGLTDRFSIGVNIKYLQERIFHSTASGVAFDVGTMFITPFRNIRLGVCVSNVGNGLQMGGEDLNSYVDVAPTQEGNNDNIVAELKTDRFDLPIVMRVGISWDLWNRENTRFTFACDGINPNDNAQSLNVGAEFAMFKEFLLLRGGYNELLLEDSEKGLTFGAGLNLTSLNFLNLAIGYAYQNFKYLGSVNHISIEIDF